MTKNQLLLMLKLGVKLKKSNWFKGYIQMEGDIIYLYLRGNKRDKRIIDIDDYFHPHSDNNWEPVNESQTS